MSTALFGPFGRMVLDASVYTLGSAPDNQLVLQDSKVSPRHAVLQLQGQQYSIMDLGSVDGTYLNDQRLGPNMPAFLKHGDRVRVGDTLYTVEISPEAPPAYPPTVAANSSPTYDPTVFAQPPAATPVYGQSNPALPPYGQVPQPPAATPMYGQSNPALPPYGQAPQPPAATPMYGQSNPALPSYGQAPQPPAATPMYGQAPPVPGYGQSNVSSPGYPPYAPSTPTYPNDPMAAAAYTPAPGQPWGVPPAYAAPGQQQKKSGLKIVVIILIIVIVLGGAGGTFYVLNLPQPTISVTSAYHVGSTLAGASATTFTVSGKKFSHSSTITFLLDGVTVPGNSPVQSNSDGSIGSTTLTVTDSWSVGTHTLTAKDAAGYVTKVGVPLTIVTPGEDKTPGPNGAPTDSAVGTIDVTVQAADGTTAPVTLQVTAGPNGDTVCNSDDTGQPRTLHETTSDGTTVVETVTDTCSGSYKGGKLTYTETVTSDQLVFTSGQTNGLTCTAQVPYVANHLEGTFTSGTAISGTDTSDLITLNCKLGTFNQNTTVPAETDSWTGIANMQ